jgi:hypothetical protein
LITLSRRKLFVAGTAFLAAPAIVRCASLMPVKAWIDGDLVTIGVIPVIFPDGTIGSRTLNVAEGMVVRANRAALSGKDVVAMYRLFKPIDGSESQV